MAKEKTTQKAKKIITNTKPKGGIIKENNRGIPTATVPTPMPSAKPPKNSAPKEKPKPKK